MKLRPLLPAVLPWLAVVACSAASADTLNGRVVEVIDGDTVRVETPGHGAVLVRLAWIDAPDRLQPHGEAARSALNALVGQRPVRLETVGDGRGPQWRATLWATPPEIPCRSDDCPKTLDVGHALIQQGHAWHDRRRLGQAMPAFSQYEQAEFEAKLRRRGLWAEKNPQPPWDWRPR